MDDCLHGVRDGGGKGECLFGVLEAEVVGHDRFDVDTAAGDERDRSRPGMRVAVDQRSEEHTSELQSRFDLVCRLLLEKKNRERRGPRAREAAEGGMSRGE